MSVVSLLAAVVLAGPAVEVSTLAGANVKGELEALQPTAIVVVVDGESQSVPLPQILEVRFTEPRPADPATEPGVHLGLVDGTKLRCSSLTVADDVASVAAAGLDPLQVPLAAVTHLRFGEASGAIEQAWTALTERELKRDLLVVRKGDVLDHLEGTVGAIDDMQIRFVLDGTEIPIKREKVFGVVYGRRTASTDNVTAAVALPGGAQLSARSLKTEGNRLLVTLASGAVTAMPLASVGAIDFSFGKIRYLSKLEPRQVDYTFFFDDEADRWLKRYRKDRNQDGGPIRIGKREFSRGLCIYSRTLLRYRLSGEYRRSRAVMGIEESDPDVSRHGDVHVTITAIMPNDERKVLLDADVRGSDRDARDLDLDVTAARDLEVLVDYGGNDDVADHLALGDARLLK